ncbi:MAG: MBL fold metallo-hydrolase, partial [Acidobacteria bacterium]|nr:MBL fold metallo-hydrolase [Acidobacteriota bacterium]
YWDAGAIFGVVPKTLWSAKIDCDELNRIPLAFNCYLIETGERTILLDTAAGDKMDPRARERMKLAPEPVSLPAAVAAQGVDPERIDVVVNTHLHWDHCGGNTELTAAGPRPAFPRAVYYASRGELEHARERHIRDRVSYIPENYEPLIESGRMRLVDGETEIAPGVRLLPAPGHTRDHSIVAASSNGATFCFLSDLAPTSAHLAPTWVAAFDLYPLVSIETKLHWLRTAARESWICGFGHDTAAGFARIRAAEGKFEIAETIEPPLGAAEPVSR